MNEAALLPRNASDLEHDLDASAARIGGVPVPIRDLWDPDKAPVHTLPWLAWALSIDFWDDAWSERQKRAAIRQSWRLHRRKGTMGGLRDTVRLSGGRLIRATVPPSKTFIAPSWTPAERRAWLSRFPELRVYQHRDRGPRAGAHVTARLYTPDGKSYLGGGARKGTAFPAVGTAFARMDPRAYVVQPDGTETALTSVVTGYKTVTQEAITVKRGRVEQIGRGAETFNFSREEFRGRGAFCGDPDAGDATVGKMFPGSYRTFTSDKRARERFYTVEFTATTPDLSVRTQSRETVQPSLAPIHVKAERGTVQETRKGISLGASYVGQREFLADTYAGERMFRRTRLFDPGVTLERRGRSFHLGVMRLGMPAYHAELQVRMTGKRLARQAGRYVSGFPLAHDNSAYDRLYTALRWAVPARDKVLINTRTRAPVRAGAVLAGTSRAGEWQEV